MIDEVFGREELTRPIDSEKLNNFFNMGQKEKEGITDEEMAEEYAKWLCKTCTLDTCRNNTLQTCAIKESIKQAFLAGLKAGRPQWHDLRKDPNDLPKNKRNVWCDYGEDCDKGFYDKDDGGWWIEGHIYCSIIIAWCELPTFDKE